MPKLRYGCSVKRLLFVLVAAVAAESANGGDLFSVQASGPASLERLSPADYRLPWLSLADGPLGSLSTAYTKVAINTPRPVATMPKSDSTNVAPVKDDWRSSVWTSGEVGFLYGQSLSSKHSFDTEQGYIFGTAGNDNIQISAGASYQRWNERGWRGH